MSHEAAIDRKLVSLLDGQILTPEQRALRENYNRRAEGYRHGSCKVGWQGAKKLVERLTSHFAISGRSDLAALDLGTGTGEIGVTLKEINAGIHVTGVDFSEEMITLAVQDGFVDKGYVGTLTDLSWCPAEMRYDLVTSCGVFEHLKRCDIPQVAANIARVTKEGGLVGITFEPEGTQYPGPRSNTLYDSGALSGAFEAAGFEVIEVATLLPAWFRGKDHLPVENRILVGRRLACD